MYQNKVIIINFFTAFNMDSTLNIRTIKTKYTININIKLYQVWHNKYNTELRKLNPEYKSFFILFFILSFNSFNLCKLDG